MKQNFRYLILISTFFLGTTSVIISSVIKVEAAPTNTETAKVQSEIQGDNSHKVKISGLNGSNALTKTTQLTLISQGSNQNLTSNELGSSSGKDLMSQITSVAELSDIQPTDWAFQALQALVERYGAIAGYPDRAFRGNRAMSRYEFAAALHAALERINELIASGSVEGVTQEDLATLRKLQAEFTDELTIVGDRLDVLATRTAQLEANQFSTTTQLSGSAIFALTDAFGEQAGEDNNTVFQQRVRLNFDTSFTGKDRLRTRLAFGNFEQFDLPTEEGRLGFDSNSDGGLEIGDLEYRFPLGEIVTVLVEVNDAGVHDFTDVINPFFASSDSGAISRFGRRNPIYRMPHTNAGLGARLKLSDALSFDFGYLAGEANNPNSGTGLFNGDYGAISQLTFTPSDRLAFGLTYIHSYAGAGEGLNSGTGSTAARLNQLGPLEIELPAVANSYGIEANYRINDSLAMGGWIGYTSARVISLGDAEIWNYALTIAFPDLGKGNLGGIVVGMQPKLTGVSDGLRAVGQVRDPDTSLHIEGFYRYQLTDNIAITPGIIWLTAPNHNENNDDIVIGTIRTTFEF